MKTHIMKASSAVAFVSALLLSACGGGGGGGEGAAAPAPAQAPSTVTSANAIDVAANAYAAAGVINGEATGGPVLIASTSTNVSSGTASKGIIDVTLKQIYKVVDAKSSGSLQINETTAQQYACTTSGTVTYSVTAAASGAVSNGDSITMTAANCVEGTVVMNGTFKVEFVAVSGTPSATSPWSATLKSTYTDFSVSDGTDGVSISGDMTMNINQVSPTNISYSVSGSSFVVTSTSGGITTTENLSGFSFSGSYINDEYTSTSEFTMTGTFPNLGTVSYVVTINTPFKQMASDSYPYQGLMTVTATDKSSVRLNVIDNTSVQIQIDKDGDGMYEETTTTTWAELAGRV